MNVILYSIFIFYILYNSILYSIVNTYVSYFILRFYVRYFINIFYQFSSVAQLCPPLCDLMDCSTPGFPVHHQLPELAQTPVHWVSDAIKPSHPLLSPFPPNFNLSHQGLVYWVSSSYQVDKIVELQFQHQCFQWIYNTDFPQDRPVWSPDCQEFIHHHSSKHQFSGDQLSFGLTFISIHDYWKKP